MLAEAAASPFDLSNGPLARTVLYRLDEDEHVLFLSMDHIVTDGRSVNILLRELATLYDAFVREEAPSLVQLKGFTPFSTET